MRSLAHTSMIVSAVALAPLAACGSVSVEEQAKAYHRQQASDLIAEYARAQAQGDLIAMCVKSNQVSAAYRDAKDPADAEAWDAKRSADCQAARTMLTGATTGSPPRGH